MAHHDVGRRLEALDQETALVVDREAEGPGHPAHAARSEPTLGGLEQGSEHLGIILGLEEAEMAGGIAVALQMQVIDLGADPPDRALVPDRQPVADLGVVEPRVLLGVQVLEALEHERLHPVPVARVERRRQQQESLQRGTILDPVDAQPGRHSRGSRGARDQALAEPRPGAAWRLAPRRRAAA